MHLLQLDEATAKTWQKQLLSGDKSEMPGMVRASFGCYNNKEDVDKLVTMLHRIAIGEYDGDYVLDPASGEYTPKGYEDAFSAYFLLE